MARVVVLVLAAAAPLVLSACASPFRAPVQPPAALVTVYRAPLQVDLQETRLGSKRGKASAYYLQEPFFTRADVAWGDASVEAAARKGGMGTVHHADYDRLSILGIFELVTVRAYGE